MALGREGNNWHLQEHRKNINDRDSNAIRCGEGVICSSNRVDRQNNVKSSCWWPGLVSVSVQSKSAIGHVVNRRGA